jgi:uncharacterized protein
MLSTQVSMKRSQTVVKAVLALYLGALLCSAQELPALPQGSHCGPGEGDTYQQCLQKAERGDWLAQYNLGVKFSDGDEVVQDYQQAMSWFLRSAEQGNPLAEGNIAALYFSGKGVPEDDGKGFQWYHKAAEHGHVTAQADVGIAYLFGRGVPQDYQAAVEWLRKAAEQGDALGQRNLGFAYRWGYGVPQDYVQAHMWFNLASTGQMWLASPNQHIGQAAGKDRDEVASKMTPAQIAEAQRLAREFQTKGR